MQRSIRLALLFAALLLFLLITPFVVLYAIGYRLSPGDTKAIPVGVILIETNPRRADIYVDGAYIGRSPRAVPNVAPGEAEVRIAKAGYDDWQKRVSIEPTLAAEFRDIRLFPTQSVITNILNSVRIFSLSPHEKLIAAVDEKNTLHVVGADHEAVVTPQTVAFTVRDLEWSSDSTTILMIGDKQMAALYLSQTTPVIQPLRNAAGLTIMGWDEAVPGKFIAQNASKNIVSYTLSDQAATPIARLPIAAMNNASIIGIDTTGQVVEYDVDGTQTQRQIPTPPQPMKKLVISRSGELAAITENNTALTLRNGVWETIAPHALDIDWSPDDALLWIQTAPNELYVYNASDDLPHLASHTSVLVSRLSRPFSDITWYSSRHILYQVGDEIVITEIDTRDHPIVYAVDTTNIGQSFTIATADGNTLYYLKKTKTSPILTAASLIVPE